MSGSLFFWTVDRRFTKLRGRLDFRTVLKRLSTYGSVGKAAQHSSTNVSTIGKPQLGILWSRDSLSFKRLCGNNPGTIWSTFRTVGLCI